MAYECPQSWNMMGSVPGKSGLFGLYYGFFRFRLRSNCLGVDFFVVEKIIQSFD